MRLHGIQKVCRIRIQCCPWRGTACIVDKDVDLASIFEKLTHAPGRTLPIIEISGNPGMTLLGGYRQGIAKFCQGIRISGKEGDMGSISSQPLGASPANTLSRSAYDGSSAFKWECHGTYTSRPWINFAEGNS